MRQGIFGSLDLLTAHRASEIENYTDADRRILVTKERNVLLILIIEYAEGVLFQPGHKAAVRVGNGDIESDEVSVDDDGLSVINLIRRLLILTDIRRRWRGGRIRHWRRRIDYQEIAFR